MYLGPIIKRHLDSLILVLRPRPNVNCVVTKIIKIINYKFSEHDLNKFQQYVLFPEIQIFWFYREISYY